MALRSAVGLLRHDGRRCERSCSTRQRFLRPASGADLIGFRSFGPDGQVPGGSYDTEALDTGGGLRPDLVGHGLGREAIETGLSFGRSMFAPNAFRVTVANFNTRALRVVESVGFRPVTHFAATNSGREYTVLLRPES